MQSNDPNVKDALQRLLEGLHQTLQVFKVFSHQDIEHGNGQEEPLRCIASSSQQCPDYKRSHGFKRKHDYKDSSKFPKETNKDSYGKYSSEDTKHSASSQKVRGRSFYEQTDKGGSFFPALVGEGLVFPQNPVEERKRNDSQGDTKRCPKTCPRQHQKQSDFPMEQNPKFQRKEEKIGPKQMDKQQPLGSGKRNGNEKQEVRKNQEEYSKATPAKVVRKEEKIESKKVDRQEPSGGGKKNGHQKQETRSKQEEYSKPPPAKVARKEEKIGPKKMDKQQPSGSGNKNATGKSQGCCKGCCSQNCKKLKNLCRGNKNKKPQPHKPAKEQKGKHDPSKPRSKEQIKSINSKSVEIDIKCTCKKTKKKGSILGSCCKPKKQPKDKNAICSACLEGCKILITEGNKKICIDKETLKGIEDMNKKQKIGTSREASDFENSVKGRTSPRKAQKPKALPKKLDPNREKLIKVENLDGGDNKEDGDKKPKCSVCSKPCEVLDTGQNKICGSKETLKKIEDRNKDKKGQSDGEIRSLGRSSQVNSLAGSYRKKDKILDLDNLNRQVKADFVLIFLLNLEEQFGNLLECFLQSIQGKGMQLECIVSADYIDILFIKVQIPIEVAMNLAKIYDVKLACTNPYFEYETEARYICNNTTLTSQSSTDSVIQRNRSAVKGDKPKEPTNPEKTRVLYELLKITKFSDELDDFGIWEMQRKGIIVDAYPIHDGTWEWTRNGPLNERQLLKDYWASVWKIFTIQPIQHIYRYFGPEVAYYFAFMDWYITMLIPAAIFGLITVLYGWATMSKNPLVKQYCVDKTFPNKIMCPMCENPKTCGYSLFESCTNFKLTYLLDNTCTIWFAVITSFWGILFLALWTRQQNSLKVSWNLHDRIEEDLFRRPAYFKKAQEWSVSPATGEREPQVTTIMELLSKLFVVAGMLMIFMVLFILFLLILYRIQLTAELAAEKTKTTEGVEAQLRSPAVRTAAIRISILSSVIVVIFNHFFDFVVIFLTNVENPKTQGEYDRSYILKLLVLSCVNHYNMVFYLAFFRSWTYTYPGDLEMWKRFYGINADICDTSGCLIDVVYYITVLLIVKTIVNALKQLILPALCKRKFSTTNRPQWELDYDLTPNSCYRFSKLNIELVTQYGLVIFFMPAFPLLPLLVLIVNIIDTRVNAKGLVQLRRRPIARQICERELWNQILFVMTVIGIIIHGFVATFLVNYVERATFATTKMFGSDVTYLDAAFTSFEIDKFSKYRNGDSPKSCLSFVKRSSTAPFQTTPYYSQVLGNRLYTVAVLVGLVIIGGAIFLSTVPKVPLRTKQKINYLENQEVF